MHKNNNIENITNLSESMPSESDAFQGNRDLLVVPLSGVAGRLAVLKVCVHFFKHFCLEEVKIEKESFIYLPPQFPHGW